MPAVRLLFPVFGIICFLFVACNAAEIGNATVTLGHGGQLLGKRFNLQNVDLDIFLSKWIVVLENIIDHSGNNIWDFVSWMVEISKVGRNRCWTQGYTFDCAVKNLSIYKVLLTLLPFTFKAFHTLLLRLVSWGSENLRKLSRGQVLKMWELPIIMNVYKELPALSMGHSVS